MRGIISPISVISQMGKTPYQLWTEYRTALCVHVMMMAEESRNTDMDITMLPAVPNLIRQCIVSRPEIVRMPRLLRT